jgi:hypothetical protein
MCTNDHDDEHITTPRRSKKLKDMQGTIMDTDTKEEHKHDSNCAPSCGHDHGHEKEEHGHAKRIAAMIMIMDHHEKKKGRA